MFFLTSSFEYCIRGSSQYSKSRKKNKRHSNRKSKTIIHRWHDCLFRKFDAIYKKAAKTNK